MPFRLGKQELQHEIDSEEDILYLWVDGPRASVTYETTDGHLVHLDPETQELVGVTVMDYEAIWQHRDINIEIPEHQVPKADYTLLQTA